MSILGIGVDVVALDRIADLCAQRPAQFAARIFTANEQRHFQPQPDIVRIAARFAPYDETDGSGELRHDTKVGGRAEGDDLALALDDQPHGDRLHAAGREGRADLLPQHGRELEADQPVQDAARLLGIDEVHVDRAGLLDGLEDGAFGDFVEDDALRLVDRETQHFGQVPCDGLSFAVFIGGEPDGLRLRQFREFVDDLLLVARDFVYGGESLGYVDSEILFRKVADVSEARFDDVVLAQELLDGLRLGRGLYDD